MVLGANGRPAHVIEIGPLYLRLDIAGFDQIVFPARGGYASGYVGNRSDFGPLYVNRARQSNVAAQANWDNYHAMQDALTTPPPTDLANQMTEPLPIRRTNIAPIVPSTSGAGGLALGVPS